MAITQTSKIQIRTGNLSDLPQLATGEMAYATDADKLFIGNESTSSWLLPTNTEILTALSDVPAAGSNGDVLFNNDGFINGATPVNPNAVFRYNYLGGSNGNGLLTVNNINVVNNSNLGSISNVTITGGSAGQVLSTDGSGTLSWITGGGGGGSISNGTSNVSVPAADGNVNTSVGGVANVLVVTSTGANVAGTMNVTGNSVIGGNLTVTGILTGNITGANASNFAGSVTTNAQPNITSVGTLTSLSVSGNVAGGNVSGTGGVFTYVTGNGANLSAITGANVTGTVPSATVAASANSVAGGNVTGAVAFATTANSVAGGNVSGQVANALVTGTVYTNAQPNITSVGTLTSLAVTGNISGGNVTTAGNVVAIGNIQADTGFIGNSLSTRTGPLTITATGTSNITLSVGTGNINLSTPTHITNLLDPVSAQDAATKIYVDALVQGLKPKAAVQCATNTNISLTGAPSTIDGYTLATGDRVLVKAQTATQDNGIYTYDGTNLTRSTDADTAAEIGNGTFVFVEYGSTFAGSGFVQTSDIVTLGTSPIVFSQFSTGGSYTAGAGLTLTGSQFSVATTAVTAGSYGNATHIPSFTVSATGQLTAVSVNQVTSISNGTSNVSIPTINGNVNTSVGGNTSFVVTDTGANVTGTLNVTTNSTTDAVRITQTGTGNAFVVEDVANPDSTPFIVDTNGRVGIGGAPNTSGYLTISGPITDAVNAGAVQVTGEIQSGVTSAARYFRTNATTAAASFTVASINHYIAGQGTIGAGSTVTNQYGFVAQPSLIGATNNYGFFGSIPAGTGRYNIFMNGTADNYMAGRLGIGALVTSEITLGLGKTMTGGTTAYGMISYGTIQSDVTAAAVYNTTLASTSAASFTLPELVHYNSSQGAFGVGSTVNNQYGFFARETLIGATNNYGFYSAIPNATGRWNFYAAGTAPSYFGGDVTATANLSVTGNINATGGAFTYVTGNGANLTAIPGANVIGTVPSATVAASANSIAGSNVSGQVGNALVSGTVYTAAQPNITSVGILTGLNSVGTVNFTSSSNVSLGPVGNVKITGGTSGQVLSTDGSGTLSWSTVDSTRVANGTSNVSIPTAAGNVNTSVGGVANVLVVTTTGANVAGTMNVTGDVTFGAAYTESVFAITDAATVTLNPNNGLIQTWVLGASRTVDISPSWGSGQSLSLMVQSGSSNTITWPSISWETNGGSQPTLATTGFSVIALWKVGAVVYGARVGDN